MNNSENKMDDALQLIMKDRTNKSKINIIMSIDQSFNKNGVMIKLKNINSLEIRPTSEYDEIVNGKRFIYASIIASELKLLNQIEEIESIEFDGTMSIQDQ